jgi:hypothetical protein
MSELIISATSEGQIVRFFLAGKIDESSDYSTILASSASRIILDFEKVTLINSSGIQKWIQFLRGLPKAMAVDFENCPLRIINQMNLIPAFAGDRNIVPKTFYAPYYCEQCDESQNVKLSATDDFGSASEVVAPRKQCAECASTMEFDGIEKKYFLFLKRTA